MQNKPFKQVSPIEYEVVLGGRTHTLKVPFRVTEEVFKAFLAAGGVVDPYTNQVQQDISQLITSFQAVGDILLTERDEDGKVIKKGDCLNYSAEDVLVLFQLATHIIENFMQLLVQIQAPKNQQTESPSENVEEQKEETTD